MPQSRFFRICLGILLPLVIIYFLTKISFLFTPVLIVLKTLLTPFLLSGFFYYLFRPLVRYLERNKLRTSHATLLIYFFGAVVTTLVFMLMGPILSSQTAHFMQNVPELLKTLQLQFGKLDGSRWLPLPLSDRLDLPGRLAELISGSVKSATDYLSGLLGIITNAVIIITSIPFIVYYLLTEGPKAKRSLIAMFPIRYREPLSVMLTEMDEALSGFISGRMFVCLLVGILIFAGYGLIGLPYPLLLATLAMILNIIPFIGPILGIIPGLIMAFSISWPMVLWVTLVYTLIKIADNNLLSPLFLGKRTDLHPLTVFLLLLVSGEVAGIVGMLVSIPLYMIAKILIRYLIHRGADNGGMIKEE